MNRRTLLRGIAIGVPVAVVGGVVSRAFDTPKPAAAVETEPDCLPGGGRLVYWGGPVDTQASGFPKPNLMPPVPRSLQSGVTAVAVATSYVLALKGGRVHGHGFHDYAGVWTANPIWRIPADATAGVTAISALADNALALRDGRVIAWGKNAAINAVPEAAMSGVTDIACGGGVGLAVKNGGVIQWGATNMPAVPEEARSGVTAVAAASHSLALREDGRVVAWGVSSGPWLQVPEAARSGVSAIAAGGWGFGNGPFSLALKNGQVIAWGTNDFGQLEAPLDTDVVAIAAGAMNGLSLTARGTVNVWSINNFDQIVQPDGLCQAIGIAQGASLCAAIV